MSLNDYIYRLMRQTGSVRVNVTITPVDPPFIAEIICFSERVAAGGLVDLESELTEEDLYEMTEHVNMEFAKQVQA